MVGQLSLLILVLLPAIASALGGVAVIVWSPSTPVESAIQHFAAGAVFAAVAELLVDLQGRAVWLITTGLIAGVLFVLLMEWGTDAIEERATASSISSTAGLLTAMGVDTLLDGFLAGLIVGALAHGGVILILAFAVEMLSFGLAAGAALPASVSSKKMFGTTAVSAWCFRLECLLEFPSRGVSRGLQSDSSSPSG